MKLKLTKEELSWSLYDCANSAYIMMLTAMIPPYIATIGQEFSGLSSAWGIGRQERKEKTIFHQLFCTGRSHVFCNGFY